MPEDDQQPLLKGIDDANEEIRQRDRINEQENNAINGKGSSQQAVERLSAKNIKISGKSPSQILREKTP